MKIALTGARGFIGTRLRRFFPRHVIIDRNDAEEEIRHKLHGVRAVVNLAGAPIIRRWSRRYRRVLWDSRVNTTEWLVSVMNSMEGEFHLVSVSATGIYPCNMACDESCSHKAHDFLGRLADAWEQEALKYRGKVSIMRLGVVLGPEGGALAKMLPVFRAGLGGVIGNGQMITSWIDIDDLTRAISFVIEKGAAGIFNAVSPEPVTNAEFTRQLAHVLRRPAVLPVPLFMLRLVYGEAASVLAGSWEVYPARLLEAGFRFRYPDIVTSLEHLL